MLGEAWSFLGNAWGLWELLGAAGPRVCDKLLGVIENWEWVGIVWTCLELLRIGGLCFESLLGVARSCWELLGADIIWGTASSCWELLGLA